MHFQCTRCILNRSPNVSTKFGEDRLNSKEMATVFRNSRWRRPDLELLQLCISNVIAMFQVEVPMFQLAVMYVYNEPNKLTRGLRQRLAKLKFTLSRQMIVCYTQIYCFILTLT